MKPAPKASILLVLAAIFLSGAEPYRKPPQAVLDVLNSPLTPTLAIGPTRHFAMQGQPIRYPRSAIFLSGAEPYRKPPQAVLDVLNSPLTPTLAIGPTRHFAMQGQPIRYP